MYPILRTAHARFDEIVAALALDSAVGGSAEFSGAVRQIGWKRFVYSAAIVNLYGGLEQFVDGLIESVAENVPDLFPLFATVPKRLRESHDAKVRELLATEGRGRFAKDEVDRLITSLASCLGDGRGYTLSAKALSFHDANLRLSEIEKLLRRIDVDLPDLGRFESLASLFAEGPLVGLYADMGSLLEDVIERRNEISHGDYTELLDVDVLLHIAEVFKVFAEVLVEEVRRSLFNSVERSSVGYVKSYLNRSDIHLVRLEADELKVGDMLFGVERRTRNVCCVEIASMMDDSVEVDHVIRDTMKDAEYVVGLRCRPTHGLGGQIYQLTPAAAAFLRGPLV